MKRLVTWLLCAVIFFQTNVIAYSAEGRTALEQVVEEEKEWEREIVEDTVLDEKIQEEGTVEDIVLDEEMQEEGTVEGTVLGEEMQEEETVEDIVLDEEILKENQLQKEKASEEGQVQEEEIIEEEQILQVTTEDKQGRVVDEIDKNVLLDEDPQYGRENGYIVEGFLEGITVLEGEVKYVHNSRFSDYTIKNVIDVSYYQGNIDWVAVKQAGIDYAIIRAGYRGYGEKGTLNKDKNFDRNIKEAIAAGIEVGVYFFSQAISEIEASIEAEYVLQLIDDYEVLLPVVIDFEYASSEEGLVGRLYNANLSKKEATRVCMSFCDTVDSAGYQAMVYANKSMLENNLNASEIAQSYKIWLANYTTSTSYGGSYEFWQYAQDGMVEGISGKVDKSFWYLKGNTDYQGVDYKSVYNFEHYLLNNADVKKFYGYDEIAVIEHFVNYGMAEGRIANEEFNVYTYKNRYVDLREAFGNDLKKYYLHYVNNGKNEGRDASGTSELLNPLTMYDGVDYSLVYDFNYYLTNNADVKEYFGNDDIAVLNHFVNYGMLEGRRAKEEFNVYSYLNRYLDLRIAYGTELKLYYMHYILNGYEEGRDGTGDLTKVPITEYDGVDYSAVYDYSYYVTKHPDIKEAFGDNDVEVLKHFISFGISEARQAKATFNAVAYKSRYEDLQKAFGNNWKEYYMHYIRYGENEQRNATCFATIEACRISSGNRNVINLNLELQIDKAAEVFTKFFIAEMSFYEDEIYELFAVDAEQVYNGNICVSITGKEAVNAALMDRFALAIESDKGEIVIVSLCENISNPEAIALNTDDIFKGTSKKGLQGIYYSNYDGGDDILEARNANTKQTLINLDLASVVTTNPNKAGYKPYTYKGNTYYFSELSALKANVRSLNTGYKQYLNGNSGTTPVAVTLCLLLSYNSENSFLIDPAARTPGRAYYTLNVREEYARETLEALFFYLGETFGQSDCYVSNWILGNEINSSKAWNYSGSLDFDTYMDCYATAFRMLYTGVKSEKTGNTVSISLDNGWTAAPDTYAGKTTLDTFAKKIDAQNPNVEWSIAYHPYSYPLTRVDFWNDYKNTTDSLSTPYISMRNINVLTNYVGTLESTYGKKAGSIRVLLTEQGYSYSGGAENQAMAIARGYYIAEFNDRIDAFIIRAVVDDADEASGKLYFGLMNSQHEKRIAFYVYEFMDSSRSGFASQSSSIVSDENRSKFEAAKSIVCNTNWSSMIPGFDDSKLAAIK